MSLRVDMKTHFWSMRLGMEWEGPGLEVCLAGSTEQVFREAALFYMPTECVRVPVVPGLCQHLALSCL